METIGSRLDVGDGDSTVAGDRTRLFDRRVGAADFLQQLPSSGVIAIDVFVRHHKAQLTSLIGVDHKGRRRN